jgi:hypothetical protein
VAVSYELATLCYDMGAVADGFYPGAGIAEDAEEVNRLGLENRHDIWPCNSIAL